MSAAWRTRTACASERRALAVSGYAALLAAAVGCSAADRTELWQTGPVVEGDADTQASDCLGQRGAALSVIDRSLVGSPVQYQADSSLRGLAEQLAASQRARRTAAWKVAARVLRAVPLEAALGADAVEPSLPAWQTWHAMDDLTRVFRRLYAGLTPEEQNGRARLSTAALDAAWEWNDAAIADAEHWSMRRQAEYREAINASTEVAGLGGIYRVSYSPAASRHLIQSYPEVLGCSEAGLDSASGARGERAACGGATHAPSCLAAEFPTGAVLVKASWRRADVDTPLPVYDTSAAALERRLSAPSRFAWGEADGEADPGAEDIYTLRLPNGNAFRLAGLHIMSKELEHWFWITLWWSAEPDRDFGADRPDELPAPFQSYKLCAVVDYVEGDPDPSGGYGAELPSLAGALAATHAGAGNPTWCSNPYLEAGDGNASTNCIGCHQHGGTALRSEDVLRNAQAFPEFGRTPLRREFPSDYVFATTQGDNLGAMYVETEDHYATR